MNKGQSLIELLITIGLAAILLPALLTGLVASRNGKAQQDQRLQGVALLKEAQEAVRVVREASWTTFAADGTYHPVISGSTWSLISGTETINGFTRQIVISDVYRNASGTIVTSGGILDPSTKQVVSTVFWSSPLNTSVTATSYFTRYSNTTFLHTTVPDFSGGTFTNTTVATTSGTGIPNDGQVQLGGSGGIGGDWCNPSASVVATYDLSGQGLTRSISATSSATQDLAYVTSGDNQSSNTLNELTISHANPPVIANPNANTEGKAYGIFVDNAGSYVYFNENNPPNHTVRIANGTTLANLGYFDVFHSTAASVYVFGNTGYTTIGSTLYSFDLNSKTGSRPQLGSVSLAGTGNRVFVVGTKAYVATSNATNQLQIIDVSNPSSMTVTKSINVGNGLGGVDVYVNGAQTYAYLATSYFSGQNDFFIIDLNNTNNIYGYSTNGMNPNGITITPDDGKKAILVGSGGTMYQVFNIATPSAAFNCGGMSPSGISTIFGVASVIQTSGNVFSYIITDNANAQFQAIAGGSGGQVTSSGSFVSAPFTATTSAMFNSFSATISQPPQTTISLQVATALPVSNSCSTATYTYVGPDSTSGTYFTPNGNTISGQIPLTGSGTYQNPAQCFSYKVYLTTNSAQSPVLYDMTVNYSP